MNRGIPNKDYNFMQTGDLERNVGKFIYCDGVLCITIRHVGERHIVDCGILKDLFIGVNNLDGERKVSLGVPAHFEITNIENSCVGNSLKL